MLRSRSRLPKSGPCHERKVFAFFSLVQRNLLSLMLVVYRDEYDVFIKLFSCHMSPSICRLLRS